MDLRAMADFDSYERLGLGFIVVGGSISLVCVTGILVYTAFKRLRGKQYGSDVSDSNLFLNLMFADLIHAVGVMFNLKWAAEGGITEGRFCTAQAILIQIGNNGISLTSLAITIDTFLILVLYRKPGEHTSKIVLAAIWICTGLVVGIPLIIHKPDILYGDTDYWCWIDADYTAERVLTDYIWVWLTGLAMAVLYPIIALTICGLARKVNNQATYVTVAKKLLLYPLIYNFCILPNSIARWLSFTNHSVPNRVILAANAIRALCGFFDLVVFSITRPAMVFGTPSDAPEEIHDDSLGFPSHWHVATPNKRPTHSDALDTPEFSPVSSQHDTFNHSLHARRPVMSGSEV